MKNHFKKVLLVILDGFGIASRAPGNMVTSAGMKTLDMLINNYPALGLQASGPNVGLTWGEPGNSEVGHTCLGAGRIVLQDAPRIDQSITSGEFFKLEVFKKTIEHIKLNNSALHILGLIGSGNVHASQLQLYALLELAKNAGLQKVFIHAITDGRDTARDEAIHHIADLERKILQLGVGKIVSITGRFYAMDRAEHWDLTEKAYQAIVLGEGEKATGPLRALEMNYEKSIYDETIPPTVIENENQDPVRIISGDAVIMSNYRPDRAVQIIQAIVTPNVVPFAKKYSNPQNVFFVTMTEYSQDLPVEVAFRKAVVKNTLSEVLSNSQKKQFHIAEREKYAHVTYFFDNGKQKPFAGEEWEILKSNASYKELYQNVPQMSAPELTAETLKKLGEPYDFVLVNFANPDVVGHTGNMEASITALRTIDNILEQLHKYVVEHEDLILMITSDHGNIEEVKELKSGEINKTHSTNPVPFLVIAKDLKLKKSRDKGYLYLASKVPQGLLSDVAPTILEAFEIAKPEEMTGVSLWSNISRQISE